MPAAEARSHVATSVWRRPVPVAFAALLVGGLVAGVAVWSITRPEPRPVARFPILTIASGSFNNTRNRSVLDFSPDGLHVAYTANERLWLRALDQLQAEPVPGTEGAVNPFFSPDGQWVGFYAGGELKRVSVTGGAPATLGALALPPSGASWGEDDMILVGQGSEGIWRLPGAGGTAERVVAIEPGEQAHGPQMLPGGEWVLFTVVPRNSNSWDQGQIVAQSTATDERMVLVEGGRDARYVPTGHLVYAENGGLLAVPFEVGVRRVTGRSVPLLQGVAGGGPVAAAHFGVSRDGSMAYLAGAPGLGAAGGPGGQTALVWVDRQGREEPLAAPPRAYLYPRLSPDGRRVALDVRDQESDVWVWDLGRETLSRLTFDPGPDRFPAWWPDDRRVVFSSRLDGSLGNLFWQAPDGTGAVERLAEHTSDMFPTSVSPDGARVLVNIASGGATGASDENDDIGVVSVNEDGRVTPLLQTSFGERNGEVSPDGRWMAYESDESGREEIYVRPFPEVESGRWQVSTGGGTRPAWARNGRELFYFVAPGRVMSVSVQADGASFSAGRAQLVIEGPYLAPNAGRTYDVSPDGQRFLMIKDAGPPEGASDAQIVLIQNWTEELKRLVPVN